MDTDSESTPDPATADTPLTDSKPAGKKPRRLSMREERFAQAILDGQTQRAAALYAGYSPAAADNRASEKMHSLSFREALRERALARGIGVDYALDKLTGLIEQEQMLLGGREKDQVHWAPDGATRAKGVQMLMQSLGAFPDPRADVNVQAAVTVVLRQGDSLGVDPFASTVGESTAPPIEGETREI